MGKNLSALLVHDQETLFGRLKYTLEQQGVEIRQARSCAAALPSLATSDPPPVVFTSTALPDGTWVDVVNVSRKTSKPVHVVVVSRLADQKLYLEALDRGAFDFIAPPFRASDIAHIVRAAVPASARLRHAAPPGPAPARPRPGSQGKVHPA